MNNMTFVNFYEAYHFLDNHPEFRDEFLGGALLVEVVKVNPQTNEVEENPKLNTKTRIWLECGEHTDNGFSHDIDLDTGGDTFEEAIINLANLVLSFYGRYTEEERERAEKEWRDELILEEYMRRGQDRPNNY